jgi:hypothetical protein
MSEITITERGPEQFALSVTVDGQSFDCGLYLNRAAAQQAARLFISRKAAESRGRKKSPRKKT